MNRMGWVIALAGSWALTSVALVGLTNQGGGPPPDCAAGYYLSGSGWCVRDPAPANLPSTSGELVLVAAVRPPVAHSRG